MTINSHLVGNDKLIQPYVNNDMTLPIKNHKTKRSHTGATAKGAQIKDITQGNFKVVCEKKTYNDKNVERKYGKGKPRQRNIHSIVAE